MSALQRSKKPARKDWPKSQIKAALEDAGWSCRRLAKKHEVAHSYFSDVLVRPNPRAQALLAAVIGEKPSSIWPSRYDEHDEPLRGLYAGSRKNGRDYTSRSVRRGRASGNGNQHQRNDHRRAA